MTSAGERMAVGAALLLGATALAALLGAASGLVLAAGLAAMAGAAFCLLLRQLRRPLLAALFVLAPIDISKSVIAPLGDRYFASGPYYSPGLYLSLAHLAVLALLLAWLGRRVLLERRWPPVTRLDWLALLYLAIIWMRSIGNGQGLLSLGSAGSYSLAVLAFYLVSHAVQDVLDLRLVIKASLVALFAAAVYVALQSAAQLPLPLPGSKGLSFGATVNFGGAQETFRPAGFMNHPNSLAHYLVIVLPPAFALFLLGPSRLSPRAWWMSVAAIAVAVPMLLISLSRGGWASAALSLAFVGAVYLRQGLLSRRRAMLALLALALGAAIVVAIYPKLLLRLTAPDNRALESRVLLADMAFTIIKAHPLAGVGFGDYNRAAFAFSAPLFATVSEDYQLALHQLVVHNHFLLVAAELGIPAMLLFVWILWRFLRLPWPMARWRDPGAFALAVGLAGAVLGETLFFNSDNYYADIRVFLFWLSAGLLQALVLQAGKAQAA